MEAVVEHLREYAFLYAIGVIGVLPLLFLARKWSVPFILYTVELTIYLGLMHVGMYVLVGVTRWFKESSSMRALQEDGRPVGVPEWGTPLLEFWDKAQYDPEWIIWAEVVFGVITLLLMWRYRPMKVQRKRKARHFASEQSSKKYAVNSGTAHGKARPKGRSSRRR